MKTTLYSKHQSLEAQFVDFGGWEMPLQYHGIREEHMAVRNRVGLFDVSHMGRIAIEGPDAEAFMDYVSANKIAGKKENSATYTVLCSSSGGCVDDTIVYCIDPQHYFIIANAVNREKDLQHLQERAKDYNVRIIPLYDHEGVLAIQGPEAKLVITAVFPESYQLDKPMRFMVVDYHGTKLYLASTGYTGAGGFELYAPNEIIEVLWDAMMQFGTPHGIVPAGLGARNTLRLEMGYALYGHEIDDTIAPTESVAAWSVKLDKSDFFGKSSLTALEHSSNKRSAYAVLLKDPGVIRDNYSLFKEGTEIGKITSGGYSPTLNRSIGLALVHGHLQMGSPVEIQIRKQMHAAEVVSIPFIHSSKEVK